MFKLICLAGLASMLSAPLAALEPAPTIPYEKYQLPNGLEVILSQDRTLPLVTVDIWYHVGAANEEPTRTGFAHLFEHMMFTGSKHVPRGLADKLLEAAGASDSNASTSFDRTNYYDTLPSNQLELALWTHADRMGYLLDSLDQKALSNQQDVVRNERRERIENQPYGIVDEAVFRSLFPVGHPYRPYIMGSHADIQAARLADVRDFFKRYYRPNNATLTIVGDFDAETAKRLVNQVFRLVPARARRGPAGDRRPADCGRAPRDGHRPDRARAGRPGMADAAALQARRCRARCRGAHPRRRQVEPAVQAPCLRTAACAGSQRRTGRLCADVDIRRAGIRPTRAYGGGVAGRDRRRARPLRRRRADRSGSRARPQPDRAFDVSGFAEGRRARRHAEHVQPVHRRPRLSAEGHRTLCRGHDRFGAARGARPFVQGRAGGRLRRSRRQETGPRTVSNAAAPVARDRVDQRRRVVAPQAAGCRSGAGSDLARTAVVQARQRADGAASAALGASDRHRAARRERRPGCQ